MINPGSAIWKGKDRLMGMRRECKEKTAEQTIAAASPKVGLNPSGMIPPVLECASVLLGLFGSRSGTSFRCGGCFAVFGDAA